MQLQAKEHQRLLANYQKLGISKEGFLYRFQREHGPANILISNFQFPELGYNKFLLKAPSSFWYLSWQPQQMNTPHLSPLVPLSSQLRLPYSRQTCIVVVVCWPLSQLPGSPPVQLTLNNARLIFLEQNSDLVTHLCFPCHMETKCLQPNIQNSP